jgi:hypothetical protein
MKSELDRARTLIVEAGELLGKVQKDYLAQEPTLALVVEDAAQRAQVLAEFAQVFEDQRARLRVVLKSLNALCAGIALGDDDWLRQRKP